MGVCRDEMPTQEYGSHIGLIGGPSCYPLWGGAIGIWPPLSLPALYSAPNLTKGICSITTLRIFDLLNVLCLRGGFHQL